MLFVSSNSGSVPEVPEGLYQWFKNSAWCRTFILVWQVLSLSGYVMCRNSHGAEFIACVRGKLTRRAANSSAQTNPNCFYFVLAFPTMFSSLHLSPWNSAFNHQQRKQACVLTADCLALQRYSISSPTANFLPADGGGHRGHLQVIKSWLGFDCALISALVLHDDAHLAWLL